MPLLTQSTDYRKMSIERDEKLGSPRCTLALQVRTLVHMVDARRGRQVSSGSGLDISRHRSRDVVGVDLGVLDLVIAGVKCIRILRRQVVAGIGA